MDNCLCLHSQLCILPSKCASFLHTISFETTCQCFLFGAYSSFFCSSLHKRYVSHQLHSIIVVQSENSAQNPRSTQRLSPANHSPHAPTSNTSTRSAPLFPQTPSVSHQAANPTTAALLSPSPQSTGIVAAAVTMEVTKSTALTGSKRVACILHHPNGRMLHTTPLSHSSSRCCRRWIGLVVHAPRRGGV